MAGLLLVVSVPLADGLLRGVVAFERDTTVFYYPLMAWVSQRLHLGEFPLWTPQVFGGYPIFADGEIGLAYPPALVALFALSPDRALIALRLVHLWIAALGAFALARAWRLPYASAALAGVVFALGSFLAAQIHHENIIRTAAWLPVMLALVECALDSSTRRVRWTLFAALALGLAGVSLHSQMLAIDLLILALYGALRWAVGPLPRGRFKLVWLDRLASVVMVIVPVVVVGFGLAAVQLVPLVELAGFSPRGGGIPYSESAAYSLTPYGLIQLIFPYVFRGQGNQQWGLWTHWESYLYIGLAPLVLVTVALTCVRRREVFGWALVGVVGLILGLGQYMGLLNLHYLLWLLPGLSGLRAPGRFTIIVILAGAMLAAYGLAWLQSYALDRRRLSRVLTGWWIAFGAIVVLGAALHASVLLWPDAAAGAIQSAYLSLPRDSYTLTTTMVANGVLWATDPTNPNLWGQLAGLAIVLLALRAGFGSRGSTTGIWPAVLVAMAAVDLLAFGWMIHPREPLSRLGAEPPAVQAVDQLPSADAAPNRILASPVLAQVAADRLAPFGVQEANGYSSLQFIWHRDYLGRVLYADDGLLDLWNVRYVLDPAKYGQLSNYKGVDFLSGQALLQAPAGSSLGEQRFLLGAGASPVSVSQLRFVTALEGAVDVPQGAPVGEIELLDATGRGVGSAELLAGRDAMDWAAALPSVQPYLQHQSVEVAGTATETGGTQPRARQLSFSAFVFDQPVQASQIVVRAVPPTGEFVLFGAAVTDPDGTTTQLFGRTKTKYRQVYIDDEIRVLENTTALPRAFIVPAAHEAPTLGAALSEMIHQPFQPDREVILGHDAATPSASGADRGGTGTARVEQYSADTVRVQTQASADAWLVLSDTFYPGWSATIDGQAAPLLRGDVLFRVVPIPAGEHEVEFRFDPPSIKVGLIVTAVSIAIVALGLALAGRVRRQERTT